VLHIFTCRQSRIRGGFARALQPKRDFAADSLQIAAKVIGNSI
jgi:hypothetical protein